MEKLEIQLSTLEGQRDFDKYFLEMFKSGEFDVAERYLTNYFSDYPSSIANNCIGLSTEAVKIIGWRELNDFASSYAGEKITGISLDITEQGLNLPHDGVVEPVIEVTYYADKAFPFSFLTKQELLSRCGYHSVPWQGMFEEVEVPLEIIGLADLLYALYLEPVQNFNERNIESGDAKKRIRNFINYKLAGWWLQLRFQQAIKHSMETEQFFKIIPFVVSTHDLDPWVANIMYPEKTGKFEQKKEKPKENKSRKTNSSHKLKSTHGIKFSEENAKAVITSVRLIAMAVLLSKKRK